MRSNMEELMLIMWCTVSNKMQSLYLFNEVNASVKTDEIWQKKRFINWKGSNWSNPKWNREKKLKKTEHQWSWR